MQILKSEQQINKSHKEWAASVAKGSKLVVSRLKADTANANSAQYIRFRQKYKH